MQRLALMAGVPLKEAMAAPVKYATIKLSVEDLGLDDHAEAELVDLAWRAVETQDILTIEDVSVANFGKTIVFTPMLRDGEVSEQIAGAFRSAVFDFMSDPANLQEAAIGDPWTVHLEFRREGDTRTISSANYKLNAPDKERAKSYAVADFKKKGYTDVKAVRATPVKAVKEADVVDPQAQQAQSTASTAPLPQGLAEIAQKMGFETLDSRNSDGLDFKEVSVWAVREALVAAYQLGQQQGEAQATPAEMTPADTQPPGNPAARTSADHQQAA